MRTRLLFVLAAGLGLAACLSPDPQPARQVAKAEVAEIEHDDDGATAGLVSKSLDEMGRKFRPDKDNWDKKGTTKLGKDGVEIDLGKLAKAPQIEVVFGNAFRYRVKFFNGTEQVGKSELSPRWGKMRKKLVQRRIKVPKSAVSKGYDRITIVPIDEDRRSIASIRLLPGGAAPPAPAGAPAATGTPAGSAPKKPAPAKPAPAKPEAPAAKPNAG